MPEIRSVSNTKLKIFSYSILQDKIVIHILVILKKAFANKCVNGTTEVVGTLNIITPSLSQPHCVYKLALTNYSNSNVQGIFK